MWAKIWSTLRVQLMVYLKGKAIKLVLKQVLGTAAMGGFKVWLIKYFLDVMGLDESLHFLFNEGEYQLDKVDGKLMVKKLDEARANDDQDAYDNARDDILN